jgi:hypothetical protein
MTPVHPFAALEALVTQGQAIEFEVRRTHNVVWVTLQYLGAQGFCDVVHGDAPTLGEAVREAVAKMRTAI